MAEEGYPARLLLDLLKDLALNYEYQPTASGLRQFGDEHFKGSTTVKGAYLKNRFYDCEKALKSNGENATLNVRDEYFDAIAVKAGYKDLLDYLKAKGYKTQNKPVGGHLNHQVLYQRNPPESAEWLDKYVLGARVLPAFLGVTPVVILVYFMLLQQPQTSVAVYLTGIVICFLLAWGLSGWLATRGKYWENRLFFGDGNKGFATAYFMLYHEPSKYSIEQKQLYRSKVARYFNIDFPKKEDEQEDDTLALQRLHRAAFTIKNVVKSVVIRSALIRYGFLRNLIPSAILAAVLCLPGLVYAWWQADLILMILLGLYAFASIYYYLFHEKAVRRASEAYARYLIDEFLSR
ncbi:hypothetical protein GCM10009122_54490 [Fulvivirga kasyanovii]|uniref:Uncharacterized protein n=1 Tax=Fulvivirga kasyanovii TaxID=396812 RepID=A0ABW9RQZ0_9BACT|nr:hypothetical protein [Fulvivirga kasyanovii]MTI25365.1 hypothetical protein [Fulvivirga kasyanovii]